MGGEAFYIVENYLEEAWAKQYEMGCQLRSEKTRGSHSTRTLESNYNTVTTYESSIIRLCGVLYVLLNSNVFKPDPDTESDDLPGRWVTGSTAGEPRVNK